jgi:hypothetical protein
MFRFTIRELVLLTVIAALCVAWWMDKVKARAAHTGELRAMQRKHEWNLLELEVAFHKKHVMAVEAEIEQAWRNHRGGD